MHQNPWPRQRWFPFCWSNCGWRRGSSSNIKSCFICVASFRSTARCKNIAWKCRPSINFCIYFDKRIPRQPKIIPSWSIRWSFQFGTVKNALQANCAWINSISKSVFIIIIIFLKDDERIQQSDQCIWACLGGHLPTLLSYAQCTEDCFWAYLSCAAEALLDKSLSSYYSKMNEQINLHMLDMERENEDLPQTVHSIFTQLRIVRKF